MDAHDEDLQRWAADKVWWLLWNCTLRAAAEFERMARELRP
jgi:hypothetical protein